MAEHSDEKERLQKAAVDLFLPLYVAQTGKVYRLERMQDRPDAILLGEDGTQLGVEVAHLYPDAEEARILFGRSPKTFHGVQSSDEVLRELNGLLAEKEQKAQGYQRGLPLALVIRCSSPIFTESTFRMFRDDVQVPVGAYVETWLMPREDGGGTSWVLMRLQ